MDLSQLVTAKKVSPELAAKFAELHVKQDEARKILDQALEAALTATVNINARLQGEAAELFQELVKEIGEGDWAIDTKAAYAADRREMMEASRDLDNGR